VGVALDVPATLLGLAFERLGWLSNELPCSPGFLLAVWLETGVARIAVSGVPTVNSTDPQYRGGV
jgi:hypothetical protein